MRAAVNYFRSLRMKGRFNLVKKYLPFLWIIAAAFAVSTLLSVPAQAFPQRVINPDQQSITDAPTITIAAAPVQSSTTPTAGVAAVQIQMKFGTVVGSYTTCTAQLQTSMDNGTTWLTIGTAPTVTVTSNTVNTWVVFAEIGSTSVVVSAVSSTVALVFGNVSRLSFSCSGYGTSAPVSINTLAY